ncbi:MAG: glutathione S-transferase [Congregibacter sp.]
MITVHHLRIGRPLFTLWLIEELGLDYSLQVYDRNEMGRAPPELKAVHPLGKSPVIEDDGHVISESGAIAMHLIENYDSTGRFAPPTEKFARAKWFQWFHYTEASAFAPLLITLLLSREQDPKPPLFSMFAQTEVKLQLDYIADNLGDKAFILGDELTLPDFGLSYICQMAARLEQLGDYPTLQAYVERNMAAPAFLKALEKAGG